MTKISRTLPVFGLADVTTDCTVHVWGSIIEVVDQLLIQSSLFACFFKIFFSGEVHDVVDCWGVELHGHYFE